MLQPHRRDVPAPAPGADIPVASLWGRGPRLRLAVAGSGPAARRFAHGALACPDARLVAVTDAGLGRELEDGERPRVLASGELRAEGLDAVVAAGPVAERAALARRALERGLHVLVPAPLATSAPEAEELVALARRRELVLGVGDAPHHDGGVQALRALVRAGHLGGLQTCETVRATTAAADVLWELAARDLATLLWLRGLPDTVACAVQSHRACGSPTRARLTLRWSNGFVARASTKQRQLVDVQRTTLIGRRGTAVCADGVLSVHGKLDTDAVPAPFRTEARPAAASPTARELADFAECVASGAEPLADGRGGLDVVRLLDCAFASLARDGEAVPAR